VLTSSTQVFYECVRAYPSTHLPTTLTPAKIEKYIQDKTPISRLPPPKIVSHASNKRLQWTSWNKPHSVCCSTLQYVALYKLQNLHWFRNKMPCHTLRVIVPCHVFSLAQVTVLWWHSWFMSRLTHKRVMLLTCTNRWTLHKTRPPQECFFYIPWLTATRSGCNMLHRAVSHCNMLRLNKLQHAAMHCLIEGVLPMYTDCTYKQTLFRESNLFRTTE